MIGVLMTLESGGGGDAGGGDGGDGGRGGGESLITTIGVYDGGLPPANEMTSFAIAVFKLVAAVLSVP